MPKVVLREKPRLGMTEMSMVKFLIGAVGVLFTVVSTSIVVVVWTYQNFAQLSYVKEQNAQMMLTIDQRHREAIDHSDMNRDRLLAELAQISETLKVIEQRTWTTNSGKRR